jgi:uncharacterized membrane protein
MSAVIQTFRRAGAMRAGSGARGPSGVNVGDGERAFSMLLGGALILRGLLHRSFGGMATLLAGAELIRRGATGHSVLYQKLNLHTAGGRLLPKAAPKEDGLTIRRAMTVGKSAEELYRLWRVPDTQFRIWEHFAEVTMMSPSHAHWSLHGPLGQARVEWDTEMIEERDNELMRWRTKRGAPIASQGSVEFRAAPAGRGTEVHLALRFELPAGTLPGPVAKMLGFIPKQVAYKALWRFKSLAETHDILSIKNQPAGRNDGRDH